MFWILFLIFETSGGRNTDCILKTNDCNSHKEMGRLNYEVYSICGDVKLMYLGNAKYQHFQERTLLPMKDILSYFNISKVDVIIGGYVLHEFQASDLKTEQYIDIFFSELRKLSRKIFWLSVHKRNMTLVPQIYRVWQGNDRARRKSLIAERIAGKYDNVEYLDAFNASENGKTRDGTHFGYDVNVKKIDILFDAYCKLV